MITVRCDDVTTTVDEGKVIPWLFGFSELAPSDAMSVQGLALVPESLVPVTSAIEVRVDPPGGQGELYSITINDVDVELPAGWVIPWASGLAARHGVELTSLLDTAVSGRYRRMLALMICHQNRWLGYLGITEGKRQW